MFNFNIERLKRLPHRPDVVWQGGWHTLSDLSIATENPAEEYCLGMWICTDNGTLGPGEDMVHTLGEATPEKLLALMVAFATNTEMTGYRPGEVQVIDPETADYFAKELSETGIEVTLSGKMPQWELATGDFESFINKGPGGSDSLSLFSNPDLTMDQIIRFGEAAAEYYQAAKWHDFSDLDLFRIVSPHGGPGLEYTVILGWAGLEYGLGFYANALQHEAAHCGGNPEEFMDRDEPLWLFSFNERRDSHFRELSAEWSRMGMPLAGESAYPLIMCQKPQTGPFTAGPSELEFLTGLLLALARTDTGAADQGRWSVTVPLGNRKVEYTLELPHVLEPLNLADAIRWGIPPDPRTNDGIFEAMGKLMGNEMDGDPAEAENTFNNKFTGRTSEEIIAEADLPQTPAQFAKQHCYLAYDAVGYRKQVLARQALLVDPCCVRAFNILAEENSDQTRRLEYYIQAVTAAHDQWDLAALYRESGDLDGNPEIRPALRALAGASRTCEKIGEMDEALKYGLEFLTYSPSDGPQVRHLVLGQLLVKGRTADATRILAEWNPGFLEAPADKRDLEADTFMEYGGDRLFVAVSALLLAAGSGADDKELRKMLGEIRSQNRYLLPFLNEGKKPPSTSLENLTIGGGAVALFVGIELKDSWQNEPRLSSLSGKKRGR